jgi:beta-lactamase regulating signal transducer with metallopeptidase domain
MISSLLVEAALRSVLLAVAVWIGLRIFSVRNVLAQKAAWGFVLAAAMVMPLALPVAARMPATLVIPAETLRAIAAWRPATMAVQAPVVPTVAATVTETPLLEDKPTGHAATVSTEKIERDSAARYATDVNSTVAPGRYPEPSISNSRVSATGVAPSSYMPERRDISPLQVAGLLYLGVAGVLFFRLLYGLAVAIDVWQSARPALLDPSPLTDGLHLRVSHAVSSPVTIGSAVVLPAEYRDWDSEKLRIVLAHERSHIRQGDFYLQLLAGIYAALVWPSPLGWWLKRILSDLAEAISDRAGLEQAADPTSYAQILLQFAAMPRPTPIGVAMARSGSLSRRIERLLNDVSFRQAFAGTRRALVAVLVVPVALFAATAMVRVQAAGQAPDPASAPPLPGAPSLTSVPSIPGVPAQAVAAPSEPAAPVAPSAGVSVPEPILGGQTPTPPEIAPPAQAGAPAAAAPPSPAIAPKAPSQAGVVAPASPASILEPRTLMILPSVPAYAPMTIVAPKALNATGRASLMIVQPRIPTMAIIAPRAGVGEGRGYGVGQSTTTESGSSSYSNNGKHSGYHYSYSSNGESYAVIRGSDTEHMTFSGNWIEGRREEIDKARKQAHGDFLWFTRDGKSYFVDDPAILGQIEAMNKPMEELGKQQEALGKQQEVLGKQQEELGRQQETVSIPTPDMSKELAQLNEAMAKLKANEGKSMTQDQFGEMQERLAELQAKLGEMQSRIGAKQGEFGAKMGELGEKQGELGSQQGRLGAEQGRIAQEADRKVKSIIDQSLQDGKAHPVQ